MKGYNIWNIKIYENWKIKVIYGKWKIKIIWTIKNIWKKKIT